MTDFPRPERLDIRIVVEHYGGHIPTTSHRGVKMKCMLPGHEDAKPSAVVYEDKGYYRCFTCDRSLDGYDLIMEMESCDFKRALTIGAEKFDAQLQAVSRATTVARRRPPLRISERRERAEPRDDSAVPVGGRTRRKRVT